MESVKHRNTKVIWQNPIFWVVLFTAVTLITMFYSIRTGQSMAQHYAPQLNAITQVRVEATMAHLWLEEIISGDDSIEIQHIWDNLSAAEWYAQALLNGDSNNIVTIYPLQEPKLRQDAQRLVDALSLSSTAAKSRWRSRLSSGIGSPADQAFDKTFMDAYHVSERIETGVRKNLQLQLQHFNLIYWGLILLTMVLAMAVALVFTQHERRRNNDIQALQLQDRQLQASEKRYRTLFEKSNDAIYIVDSSNGRCLDSNAAGLKLTGRSLDELLTLTVKDITLSGSEERLEKVRAATDSVNLGIVDYVFPDKSIRKARLNAFPLEGDQVVGIAHDITDEQIAEEQLRRAQKMEAVGQLTGGIAHDFNNILAIILGNIDLLEKQLDNQEKRVLRISAIRSAAQRAADLTKQLLGFARKDASEAGSSNINQLLGDMDRLIAHTVTPRIAVRYELFDNLSNTIIDAEDFKDSLLNLVLNARDAVPKDGELTIATSNIKIESDYAQNNPNSTEGPYVRVTVSDNGDGIDGDTLQRIFEPFFTTKPQGKGTGLGLAMVYGFVNRSGGFITVDSQSGVGTKVHLYLPSADAEMLEAKDLKSGDGGMPKGHELILVVDDEDDLREIATAYLKELGYGVITASSGEEALRSLCDESDVALLFSDIIMPGQVDGHELAKRVQKDFPDVRILLASGYSGPDAASKQQEIESKILTKPYSKEDLAHRVRLALDAVT